MNNTYNKKRSQDNSLSENTLRLVSTRSKPDDNFHGSSGSPGHPNLGGTIQQLREKIEKLVAKHGPQDEPTDPQQKSKLLRDIFIDCVWPEIRNDYHSMTQDLKGFLEMSLKKESIDAEVSGRAKEVESAKKTLQRREHYLFEQNKRGFEDLGHIFREMHDLSGLRIVLQYRDDFEKAKKLIGSTFEARKDPVTFDSNREVGQFWKKPWFGAYETQNHRVHLGLGSEEIHSKYHTVMFEIQLTTFSNNLYNKLAHDLLYKSNPDIVGPQDEMVIDLSHGVARCFELCMRILRDKLKGNISAAEATAGIAENVRERGLLTQTLESKPAEEAQLALNDFESDLEDLPEPKRSKEIIWNNIIEQLGYVIFDLSHLLSTIY